LEKPDILEEHVTTILDPENGENMFPGNTVLFLNYKVFKPRRIFIVTAVRT
jgi:hypothetical protein